MPNMNSTHSVRKQWTVLLFGLLIAAAVANALAFSATTAGWIPVSDNWYFLDRIVYPYAHGGLHPSDLLVKRGPFDHSQPLRRLLLLANYEWFDLDFRVEAIFAVLAGIGALALLGWAIRRELRAGMPVSGLAFVAFAAIYFSLSSPVVFTWSLLTLGFTSHLFLFLWLLAACRVLEVASPSRVSVLVLCSFLFGLVSDDTALIATVAVVMAALLDGWRNRAGRPAALLIAACVVGIGLYLVFYKVVAPANVAIDARTTALQGVHGGGLVAQANQAWQWVLVPLSSALVHKVTLKAWFGADAGGIATVSIGIACALAHLWFWRKALTGDRNRTAFMAITIMLMFYGLVAGIVVGRVSEFGSNYLWQPRYGFIYRWHVLALLMMLIAQWPGMQRQRRGEGWSARFAVAIVLAVVALQLPLSMEAWESAKYIRHANSGFARQLLSMGSGDAMRAPEKCAVQLTVCKFDDARRQRVIGFLRERHLSVFSPEVRERNDYPNSGSSG